MGFITIMIYLFNENYILGIPVAVSKAMRLTI